MSDINKASKRNLPSWMNSKDNDDDDGNSGKKSVLDSESGDKSSEIEISKKKAKLQSSASCSESKGFDKLLVLYLISKGL